MIKNRPKTSLKSVGTYDFSKASEIEFITVRNKNRNL